MNWFKCDEDGLPIKNLLKMVTTLKDDSIPSLKQTQIDMINAINSLSGSGGSGGSSEEQITQLVAMSDNILTTKALIDNINNILSTIYDSTDDSMVATLTAGQTDVVFNSDIIKENSVIDVYCSVYGLIPRMVTTTEGSVTVSFKEQEQDVDVKVIFKRDIDWEKLTKFVTIDGEIQNKDLMLESKSVAMPVSELPYEFIAGSVVVLNNEIHLLGGNGNGTKHYKYNGIEWVSVSELPYDFKYGDAVVFNNEIHILGGSSGETKHYKYNGVSWSEVSTLPYNFMMGSVIVLDNEIHLLGGTGNGTKHYKWIDGTGWNEVSTLPYNFYDGSALVVDGNINILGGSGNSTKHYKYELTSGWVEVSTLPHGFIRGSVVYKDGIHIIGSTSTSGNSGKHYKYTNDEWSEVNTLPYNFCDGGAVIYKDEIHLLGGDMNYTRHYKAENYMESVYYNKLNN